MLWQAVFEHRRVTSGWCSAWSLVTERAPVVADVHGGVHRACARAGALDKLCTEASPSAPADRKSIIATPRQSPVKKKGKRSPNQDAAKACARSPLLANAARMQSLG